MEKTGEIYMITCIAENKNYIGQTIKTTPKRWKSHIANIKFGKKDCTLLYKAMRTYTNYELDFEVKCLKKDIQHSELDKWEEYFIKEYNTLYPNGYNIRIGNGSSKKIVVLREYDCHNEETRKKISTSQLGNRRPPKENKEKDHNGIKIPKNITIIKDDGNNKIIGYMVNNFPIGVEEQNYFSKKFMAEKFTLDEHLMFAKICINELLIKYPPSNWNRQNKNDYVINKHEITLPNNICELLDDNKHIGYYVQSDKIKKTEFKKKSSLYDNLKDAILFIKNYDKIIENDNFLQTVKLPMYITKEMYKSNIIGFKVNNYPFIEQDGTKTRKQKKFCNTKLPLKQRLEEACNHLNYLIEQSTKNYAQNSRPEKGVTC